MKISKAIEKVRLKHGAKSIKRANVLQALGWPLIIWILYFLNIVYVYSFKHPLYILKNEKYSYTWRVDYSK